MLPLVRVGDALDPFGGEVLTGQFEAFGKPVACVGDQAHCVLHGRTYVSEGASMYTMNGKAVALHGHRCDCGCRLISSLASSFMAVTP